MAAKKADAKASCPHCGYCEHCGRSDHQKFVPYPVHPVYPWYGVIPQGPYRQHPQWSYTTGTGNQTGISSSGTVIN